jgi:CRISPR-associated endonuclease Cas1
VSNGAFIVEYQKPHKPGVNKLLKLNRGVHKIKQIVVTAHGGYITLDAIEWACQQGITIYLMSYTGELLQVLTPRQTRNAKLCYLQFKAAATEQGIFIAQEIIRAKTEAQIKLLKVLPTHPIVAGRLLVMNGQKVTHKGKGQLLAGEYIWEPFEEALQELSQMKDISTIRLFEGRIAQNYWELLVGIPINWKQKDRKKIPPHWHNITKRMSDLSKYNNGRCHNNPFHSVLNFCYALLQADVLRAIQIAGLEQTVGFLHASHEDRNALVWDIMECFRPIVDASVLAFFQRNIFSKVDFTEEVSGECRMNNEELKRYVLALCRINPIEIDRVVRWLRNILENEPTQMASGGQLSIIYKQA